MEKSIKIPYNPSINLEIVANALYRRFPQYEQSAPQWSIQGNYIRVKKSFYVHATVFVKHKPKKGLTVIGVNGFYAPLAQLLGGPILHYLLRGTFISDVARAVEEEFAYSQQRYN